MRSASQRTTRATMQLQERRRANDAARARNRTIFANLMLRKKRTAPHRMAEAAKARTQRVQCAHRKQRFSAVTITAPHENIRHQRRRSAYHATPRWLRRRENMFCHAAVLHMSADACCRKDIDARLSAAMFYAPRPVTRHAAASAAQVDASLAYRRQPGSRLRHMHEHAAASLPRSAMSTLWRQVQRCVQRTDTRQRRGVRAPVHGFGRVRVWCNVAYVVRSRGCYGVRVLPYA